MWENAELSFTEQVVSGLHTKSSGRPTGEAVLLSAGLGGGGDYWRPQLATLTRRFRAVLYDHRGTGRSARDPLPAPYTVTHLAEDLRMVLDGLGIAAAHIVGHAAGGIAGIELARLAPERVRSLTIVNGWAAAEPHFRRCLEIRRDIYRAGGPAAYLKAQPLFLYPAAWISEKLADLDAQAAHHAADFQSEAALFARMAAVEAFDVRAALPSIRVPTLLISSLDDMLVPSRASRALAAGLPDASLIEMPWGGHAVNITQSDPFNEQLLSFLSHHQSASAR